MIDILPFFPFLQSSSDSIINIVILGVIVVVALVILRFVLRLASRVVALGCGLLLLAAVALLIYNLAL